MLTVMAEVGRSADLKTRGDVGALSPHHSCSTCFAAVPALLQFLQALLTGLFLLFPALLFPSIPLNVPGLCK